MVFLKQGRYLVFQPFSGLGKGSSEIMERNTKTKQEFSSKDLLDFLEHANDLVQSVSPDGRFLYVNRAWKETLGYSDEDIRDLNIFDIITPDCQDSCRLLFAELFRGKRLENIEASFRAKDGHLVYVEGSCNCRFENGVPVSTRGIFRDVSDRKRAEKEKKILKKKLERAQFFESLGVMAGGIAHDFNNILMSILGHLELLRMKADSRQEVINISKKIEASARKAAELTRQMLAFSGASNVFGQLMDVSSLIENMGSQLASMVPDNIQVRFELDRSIPPMEMDKSHMAQAIKNIFINAVEAIGDKQGTITVRTGILSVEKGFFNDAVVIDEIETGPYCYIEIEDTGHGIDPAIHEKIFEPFYSTKFQGRGLGLSAALGIVRGHRGIMKVDSGLGQGTRMRMFFPVAMKGEPCVEKDRFERLLALK